MDGSKQGEGEGSSGTTTSVQDPGTPKTGRARDCYYSKSGGTRSRGRGRSVGHRSDPTRPERGQHRRAPQIRSRSEPEQGPTIRKVRGIPSYGGEIQSTATGRQLRGRLGIQPSADTWRIGCHATWSLGIVSFFVFILFLS